ncbi:MAG: hypothetical protein DRI34_11245, partial [Deltaproteobacteria bacterium]
MAGPRSILSTCLAVLLALSGGGCFYSLDVEGKQCTPGSTEHACPAGYSCVPAADGGTGVCLSGPVDSGPDSGTCIEGEKACKADDPLVVLECSGGTWRENPCPANNYCFFTGPSGDEVDCLPDCTSSSDCGRDGYFCNDTSHHCEERGDCSPPGARRCVFSGYEAVETCDEDSRQWVEQRCESSQYCHERYTTCLPKCSSDTDCANLPDAQNPEPNSCNLADGKCLFVDLCSGDGDCGAEHRCVGGACITEPLSEATSTQGSADLDCYKPSYTVPPDEGSETTCLLEGYLTKLMGSGSLQTGETIGLTLEVFTEEDILDGNTSSPLTTVTVIDNEGKGFYHLQSGVATRQPLVFRVTDAGSSFKTTYVFGFYLRSDACAGGTLQNVDVPAMKAQFYTSYIEGSGVVVDPTRGLLLVRTLDCSDVDRLIGATVATTIPAETRFYIKLEQSIWIPDTELTETTETGWWGAANAIAIKGVVGAMAKQASSLIALGAHEVRV